MYNRKVSDALYRERNRAKCNKVSCTSQKKKPEKYKILHALWKKRNPDRVKELAARYRNNHREELNKKNREYQRNNPNVILIKNHKRRALKNKAKGAYTSSQWIALCDKYHKRCLCCGRKRKLTADHVVPLSRGGRNSIDNIQPLCGPCNSRKNTKTVDFRTQH